MLRIKKILYPTDHTTCAESAFSHATLLADRFKAEVHAVHVRLLLAPLDVLGASAPPRSTSDLDQAFEPIYRGAGKRLVKQVYLESESVTEALVQYAERENIDLIVMATHGRRGLARLALGSVAERVVRLASCPVLTVGERVPHLGGGTVRRILVPVDFSECATAALQHAAGLAEVYGARVDLLHAIYVPPLSDVYPPGLLWQGPWLDLEARSRESLSALAEQHLGPGHAGDVLVKVGPAAPAILDAAEEQDIDLLVLATHGLTGLRRFALGSVAERVVQHAPCPVFTVKSFGKSLLEREVQELAAEPAGSQAWLQ